MLMTDDEIQVTLSKALYWNEVKRRLDRSILAQELSDEINRLGALKILLILADYAEKNKKEKAKQ